LTAHKIVVSELVKEKTASESNIEQLTQCTKQLEDDNTLLRQETNKLQEATSTQKEVIKKAARKVKELESRIEDQRAEIAGLREVESAANASMEANRSDFQRLQAEYDSLTEDAGQLRRRLATFDAFTSHLSGLEVEIM
jgi:chromosome segregation ATPase